MYLTQRYKLALHPIGQTLKNTIKHYHDTTLASNALGLNVISLAKTRMRSLITNSGNYPSSSMVSDTTLEIEHGTAAHYNVHKALQQQFYAWLHSTSNDEWIKRRKQLLQSWGLEQKHFDFCIIDHKKYMLSRIKHGL